VSESESLNDLTVALASCKESAVAVIAGLFDGGDGDDGLGPVVQRGYHGTGGAEDVHHYHECSLPCELGGQWWGEADLYLVQSFVVDRDLTGFKNLLGLSCQLWMMTLPLLAACS